MAERGSRCRQTTIEGVYMNRAEEAANDWLLGQCKGSGVHYRQHGDAASACGDSWARHTSARDFVTCKSCLAILRGARKACAEPALPTAKAA
jgi:hypothetical protein